MSVRFAEKPLRSRAGESPPLPTPVPTPASRATAPNARRQLLPRGPWYARVACSTVAAGDDTGDLDRRLAEVELLRRRVLNVIPHALRTPITTLRGLAEAMT